MKYIRHDLAQNYSSFSGEAGKQKLVMDELAKLIVLHPDLVSDVLTESGIPNDTENPKKLASLIERNSDNKTMMVGITKLTALLNARENGKPTEYLSVDGARERAAKSVGASSNVANPPKKGKAKQVIAGAGNWLGNNADLVTNLFGAISAGVTASKAAKNSGGASPLGSAVDNYANMGNTPPLAANNTALYIGAGVLLVFVIGGGLFLYLQKKQSGSAQPAPSPAPTAAV